MPSPLCQKIQYFILWACRQKLSPQDKFPNPHSEECPTKIRIMTGDEFYIFTAGQPLFFLFSPCPRCASRIQTLILSFIIHIFLCRLRAGDSQDGSDPAMKEHFCCFYLLKSEWRHWAATLVGAGILACCPLLGSAAENCTNSIIAQTHGDTLKCNISNSSHLGRRRYRYTQKEKLPGIQGEGKNYDKCLI